VIPALNEAATIGAIVTQASRYGTPIVVDDGSIDATGALAQAAGASTVRHETSRGYDEALNSGFAHADRVGCDYAVTMDADGQHDPATIARFVDALNGGADVVIGIRDRRQRLAEHVFAWIARAKWGIRDPLCGIKAYRMEVYRQLGHFDASGSVGTELSIFAAKTGRRIAQLPVKTGDRDGRPRFGRNYSANKRILRALWVSLAGASAVNRQTLH
jgi:glycosyltransferase involved in cell wall biosynthesis